MSDEQEDGRQVPDFDEDEYHIIQTPMDMRPSCDFRETWAFRSTVSCLSPRERLTLRDQSQYGLMSMADIPDILEEEEQKEDEGHDEKGVNIKDGVDKLNPSGLKGCSVLDIVDHDDLYNPIKEKMVDLSELTKKGLDSTIDVRPTQLSGISLLEQEAASESKGGFFHKKHDAWTTHGPISKMVVLFYLFGCGLLLEMKIHSMKYLSVQLTLDTLPVEVVVILAYGYIGGFSLVSGIIGDFESVCRINMLQKALLLCIIGILLCLYPLLFDKDAVHVFIGGTVVQIIAYSITIPNLLAYGADHIKEMVSDTTSSPQLQRHDYFAHVFVVFALSRLITMAYFEGMRENSSGILFGVVGASIINTVSAIVFNFQVARTTVRRPSGSMAIPARGPDIAAVVYVLYKCVSSNLKFKLIFAGAVVVCMGYLTLLLGSVTFASEENIILITCLCLVAGIFLVQTGVSRIFWKKDFCFVPYCSAKSLETSTISNFLMMIPMGSVLVFMTFVHAQVFSSFILQACQTNFKIGSYEINPNQLPLFAALVPLLCSPQFIHNLSFFSSFGSQRDASSREMAQRLIRRINIGTLMCVLAVFGSGLIDLYRRVEPKLSDQRATTSCQKFQTEFSTIWLLPHLILTGLSEAMIQIPLRAWFYSLSPSIGSSTTQGVYSFSSSLGYSLGSASSTVLSNWYAKNGPGDDLVMIFLAYTALGCALYASARGFERLMTEVSVIVHQNSSH